MFLRKKITRLSADQQFLFVDLRPRADFCLKYTSFNTGLHIFRRIGNRWKFEDHIPDIRLIIPAHERHPHLPVYHFTRQIPADLRRKIMNFDYQQVKILQICAQSREGLELFLDIPVLVWLIADFFA